MDLNAKLVPIFFTPLNVVTNKMEQQNVELSNKMHDGIMESVSEGFNAHIKIFSLEKSNVLDHIYSNRLLDHENCTKRNNSCKQFIID